jgi:hypothetical protein
MEDEPEKTCTKCREDWPATVEFFHRCKGGLHSWCKACYSEDEKQREKRRRYIVRRRERMAAITA